MHVSIGAIGGHWRQVNRNSENGNMGIHGFHLCLPSIRKQHPTSFQSCLFLEGVWLNVDHIRHRNNSKFSQT